MAIDTRQIKVAKDGTVTVDGEVRGRVEKTQKDTSIYSAIGGYPGPVKWLMFGTDGNPLPDVTTKDRKRDAVSTLVQCTDPTTVDEIRRDRRTNRLETFLRHMGGTLGVSRAVSGGTWNVHYLVRPGAFCPELSEGTGHGSYCVANPDLIAMLDQAAKEWIDKHAGK